MPYNYDSYHGHHHNPNRDLAQRFGRESRHSSHPTQYIVNEGKMIVDQRTLRHTNAIIYNAPGSTMRLVPSKPVPKAKHNSFYYPPTSPWWDTTTSIHTCRGCLQRRELYSGAGGYCRDCTALRLGPPYQAERYRLQGRNDWHPAYMPERRQLGWR
ncbi:hypothetical protein F4819DRAFT_470269 [Hypoxylon fuscum]|nr:hypothetical protein F4819DRAFT_470269 [Hypoxylon fuscum]